MAVDKKDHGLSLIGMSHRLDAIPVDGTKWVGMIVVKSPTDSALLQPDEARALIEWLTKRLEQHSPWECSCEHPEGLHTGQFEDEEDSGCMVGVCDCKTFIGA